MIRFSSNGLQLRPGRGAPGNAPPRAARRRGVGSTQPAPQLPTAPTADR